MSSMSLLSFSWIQVAIRLRLMSESASPALGTGDTAGDWGHRKGLRQLLPWRAVALQLLVQLGVCLGRAFAVAVGLDLYVLRKKLYTYVHPVLRLTPHAWTPWLRTW
jgi:hypothetical protein